MIEKVYIVLSPCYETIRYGKDIVERHTRDAHAVGKLTKFIYGYSDLIDPTKPPTLDNLKFEARQVTDADESIFVDRAKEPLPEPTDPALWGRRKKRVQATQRNSYDS